MQRQSTFEPSLQDTEAIAPIERQANAEETGPWAACPILVRAVKELMRAGLDMPEPDYFKYGSSQTLRKRYQKWSDIASLVQIDEAQFSLWSTGRTRRAVAPTTERLRAVFFG